MSDSSDTDFDYYRVLVWAHDFKCKLFTNVIYVFSDVMFFMLIYHILKRNGKNNIVSVLGKGAGHSFSFVILWINIESILLQCDFHCDVVVVFNIEHNRL